MYVTNHVLTPSYESGTVLGMQETKLKRHSPCTEAAHTLARETDMEKISAIWVIKLKSCPRAHNSRNKGSRLPVGKLSGRLPESRWGM